MPRQLGNENCIWISLQNGMLGEQLTSGDYGYMVRFAKRHNLMKLLEPGSFPSIQRCRTTLARLVLLAESGHIHLVQRALGHRDIKTTIDYARMNPFLQEELAALRRSRIGKPAAPEGIHLIGADGTLDTNAFIEAIANIAFLQGERQPTLVAPGIALVTETADVPAPFQKPRVAAATIEFCIDICTGRGSDINPALAQWFGIQLRRLIPLCEGHRLSTRRNASRRNVLHFLLEYR